MGTPRTLATIVGPVTRRAIGKSKSAIGSLLADWPLIVGQELARRTRPERLSFPAGQQRGGVVTLAVDPADAVELQHQTGTIVERINAYYGYRAVDRLAFRQVPLGPRRTAAPTPEATPAERAAVDESLAPVGDAELRDRLAALGRAVYARRR